MALSVALFEHLLHVDAATLYQFFCHCQLDLFYQRVLTQIFGLVAEFLNSGIQRTLVGLGQLRDLLLLLDNFCLQLGLQQV